MFGDELKFGLVRSLMTIGLQQGLHTLIPLLATLQSLAVTILPSRRRSRPDMATPCAIPPSTTSVGRRRIISFPWSCSTESPAVERVSRRGHVLDVGLTTGLAGRGCVPTSLELRRRIRVVRHRSWDGCR